MKRPNNNNLASRVVHLSDSNEWTLRSGKTIAKKDLLQKHKDKYVYRSEWVLACHQIVYLFFTVATTSCVGKSSNWIWRRLRKLFNLVDFRPAESRNLRPCTVAFAVNWKRPDEPYPTEKAHYFVYCARRRHIYHSFASQGKHNNNVGFRMSCDSISSNEQSAFERIIKSISQWARQRINQGKCKTSGKVVSTTIEFDPQDDRFMCTFIKQNLKTQHGDLEKHMKDSIDTQYFKIVACYFLT